VIEWDRRAGLRRTRVANWTDTVVTITLAVRINAARRIRIFEALAERIAGKRGFDTGRLDTNLACGARLIERTIARANGEWRSQAGRASSRIKIKLTQKSRVKRNSDSGQLFDVI
jgi:hypothetical protein